MIAAPAMAAHHASMECSRRSMVPDQPFESAQGLRKAAANASRTFVELLSALDRKRGKGGQQKVTVEHVHIHPGGQAIVGSVETGGRGGGGAHEIREEPRALDQLAQTPVLGTAHGVGKVVVGNVAATSRRGGGVHTRCGKNPTCRLPDWRTTLP